MAQLSVEITADIRRIESALKQVRKGLELTGDTADKEAGKIARVGNNSAKGITNLTKSTTNAVPTLLEFNRVIQDAPFGIQGVANNITQLVQNFGQLRQTAGGTGAALRILLGAFSGPAGILFIVSAATSALVAFGDKLGTAKNKAEDLKKQIESLNEQFSLEVEQSKLLEESLELQGKSVLAILDARREIYRQQLLSLATQIDQQREILETQKLENQRLSGFEAISAVLSGITEKLKVQLGLTEIIDKALIAVAAANAVVFGLEKDILNTAGATAEDKQKELDISNELQALENRRLKIANDLLKLNQQITGEIAAQTEQIKVQGIQRGITADLSNLQGGLGDQIAAGFDLSKQARELSAFEVRLLEFQQVTSGIIQNGILDGFQALGNGIADALTGADNALQGFANSIFAALGNFLTQLGQAAVATGVGMLALKNAFANPVAAIAAGTALITAGALLSKATQSAPGGGASSGSFSSGGSRSFTGASSSSTSTSVGSGEVVFEIAGTKLVGVLNRTLKKDRRTVADII